MAGIIANSASFTMTSAETAAVKSISGPVRSERILLTAYPAGTTYSWAIAVPTSSDGIRSGLSDDSGASVSFVPDSGGTYVITCVVDSTTYYALSIDVSAMSVTSMCDALKFPVRANASVPVPASGSTVFHSNELNAIASKNSSGNIVPLGSESVFVLSDDTPVVFGDGSPGTSAECSRADHSHPFGVWWNDIQCPITEGTASASMTTEEYRDTAFAMQFFRYDQADTLFFRYQLPHDWNLATVKPHLHLIPMSAGAGNLVLSIKYAWQSHGAVLPAISGWTIPANVVVPIVAGDQYKMLIAPLGDVVPPVGVAASAMLYVEVSRVPASDTYETGKASGTAAANIALASGDLHYQATRPGTISEY